MHLAAEIFLRRQGHEEFGAADLIASAIGSSAACRQPEAEPFAASTGAVTEPAIGSITSIVEAKQKRRTCAQLIRSAQMPSDRPTSITNSFDHPHASSPCPRL